MSELDLTIVDETVTRLGSDPESLVAVLHALQEHYRYLPDEALERFCEITGFSPAHVAGVSTFYAQFRHKPTGEHLVRVCRGTACHVKGAGFLLDALRHNLSIPADNDTDPEGKFTVEEVGCMGCCTLAPVMRADDVTYGYLGPDLIPKVMKDFLASSSNGSRPGFVDQPGEPSNGGAEIRVGLGSCCVAKGSDALFDLLRESVAKIGARAVVKRVGCVGICHQTPMVEVVVPGRQPSLYAKVDPREARAIVERHFKPRGVRKLGHAFSKLIDNLLTDEAWEEPVSRYSIDVRDPAVAAFTERQQHIATEHFGTIDPVDLEEYLAHEGFQALRWCLRELSPGQVIEQIQESGLRGRGGAGFPTGVKWQRVRETAGDKKYAICNGDEGDPGAFMDRMILESFPYRVIEGMIIAAFAVGADEGYFYIRAEYPLALKRIEEALRRLEARGILGDKVMGTDFKFRVQISRGGGAFICGEETALLESIEGKRGMPRHRPPYPADSGLWEKPTLVNNVETYAVVPWIVRRGAKAFASLGTEKSKGTKVFALAGKVLRGGLIEVPMGITLREIVEEIGGGVGEGHKFKAVQIGGPSGGCVPAALAHTKVDYESLHAVGAIMGSGGMVVLDENDCMVDIARYFMAFNERECCGKCTFGRIGTRRMLDILDRLCEGRGTKNDLAELEKLGDMMQKDSLCGLGRTAPNPVISTLSYFREEYEAHVEKRCPAGRCKALITYSVRDNCIGCTICSQHCPADAIPMTPFEKHVILSDLCTRCDTCLRVCPEGAIEIR
ncbi:MAG: NAD(P)H-dependent oxidoreductase subunit E [Armatimonadetes bacterium]|nr:NAD(P)H-dependent oxidoreductase subunit E [Armatimonadota bacterium]